MMSVAIRKARPEGKTCSDLGLGQGPAVVRGVLTKSGSSRPLGRRAGVEEREGGGCGTCARHAHHQRTQPLLSCCPVPRPDRRSGEASWRHGEHWRGSKHADLIPPRRHGWACHLVLVTPSVNGPPGCLSPDMRARKGLFDAVSPASADRWHRVSQLRSAKFAKPVSPLRHRPTAAPANREPGRGSPLNQSHASQTTQTGHDDRKERTGSKQ